MNNKDQERVPCICGPGMMIPGTTECDFCTYGQEREPVEDNPMWGEESWSAPQDPGHRRTAKWGFYK